ncbi:MAG: enterotoxin [Kiritimatiellia bacterium]
MNRILIILLWTIIVTTSSISAMEFPGTPPGKATARIEDDQLILENSVIKAVWNLGEGPFKLLEVSNKMSHKKIRAGKWLEKSTFLRLFHNKRYKINQLRLTDKPVLERIREKPDALPASKRFSGWKATVHTLCGNEESVPVVWQLTIRDGANYVRQEATIKSELPPLKVDILSINLKGAAVTGEVPGSPVAGGNFFIACEHPMSEHSVRESDGCVTCSLRNFNHLHMNEPWTVSAVVGVVPEGQLRRGFLYYVERERAQPYKPVLQCNGWTVVHWLEPVRARNEFIDLIKSVGHELTEKRGVKVDTYLSDGCWDDFSTVWKFHKEAYPDGLAPLRELTAKYDSEVGIWIGPSGGYNLVSRLARVRAGFRQDMELIESTTNWRGGIFSLAGPNYYERFHQVCVDMVKNQGVNHIKFDGMGDHKWSGSELHARESAALLRILGDLRRIKPDLNMYQMNGDWASPYWLWDVDAIWRAGRDIIYHGKGSKRQQWITGTDVHAYNKTAATAPLLPLNCLKYHSVWVAHTEKQPGYEDQKISHQEQDVIDDIHFSIGTGKSLLEFFIDPTLMTSAGWDALAETTSWSRENADVLVDTHWIGGNPEELQIYGFASWAPRKGIVVVRNPSSEPTQYAFDAARDFELPPDAAKRFTVRRLWKSQERSKPIIIEAGRAHNFNLAPFEVLGFEAIPEKQGSS